MMSPVAASSAASPVRRRRFLTQRDFQELKVQAQCSSEVGPQRTPIGGTMAVKGFIPAPLLPVYPRKVNDIPEAGAESEVETHVSDCSELPSSASAAAAQQLELSGSSSIMSEIQRLQQENLALRSENDELRRKPQATEGWGQNLRCGAPLRYLVVSSPAGRSTGHLELGFDPADAANLRHGSSERAYA